MSVAEGSVVVSVDCMSGEGDVPYATVLAASEIVLAEFPNLRLILVGEEAVLRPMQDKSALLSTRSTVVHASDVIRGDAKPSIALRQSKGSSMRVAIEQVKNSTASAVVSAGNTGALMAIAMMILRNVPGVDRPAITVVLPALKGNVVLIDVGANVDCDCRTMAHFAAIGSAWSKSMFGLEKPAVALLNIGSEETKGSEVIRNTAKVLSQIPINFTGYAEPRDVVEGNCHVVVCDGLLGNITLKTAEATREFIINKISAAFNTSLLAKLAGYMAKPFIRGAFAGISADNYSGGVLAGLNGVVVKVHGAADIADYIAAIKFAADIASKDVNTTIAQEVAAVNDCMERLAL